jgi:transglutaminase-like putative cysteine protease
MKPVGWIVAAICLTAGLHADVQTANSTDHTVRFEYRIVNRADRAQDVTITLALPQSNERQEVLEVIPEPGYTRLFTDAFGNHLVSYSETNVAPGQMRLRGWLARVRTHAAIWTPLTVPARLPDAERRLYTRDRSNYRITSPLILELKEKLIRPGMTDEEKARAIFEYLISHVAYYRDDKWDTAPEVLQKNQGSCSEYNFAFIALLRAASVPARYTGGLVVSPDNLSHYDPRIHEDAVFHRWTEVFLERYGWLPVDASRGSTALRRFDNILNLWGRLPAGPLQTFRGDGGEAEPLNWDYVSNATPELADSLRDAPVCYWIDGDSGELKPLLRHVEAEIERGLDSESLARLLGDSASREMLFFLINRVEKRFYPLLVSELLRIGHPSALYFAVACDRLQIPLPPFHRFPLLAEGFLGGEIVRVLDGEKWDWAMFEYWWRMARPEIVYSAEKKVFVLTNPAINIY